MHNPSLQKQWTQHPLATVVWTLLQMRMSTSFSPTLLCVKGLWVWVPRVIKTTASPLDTKKGGQDSEKSLQLPVQHVSVLVSNIGLSLLGDGGGGDWSSTSGIHLNAGIVTPNPIACANGDSAVTLLCVSSLMNCSLDIGSDQFMD